MEIKMKAFIDRLVFWVKKGSKYWLVIVPFVISIASILILRNFSGGLDIFRMVGIVMEILGLLTVVWSLSRDSINHGQIGYHKSFLNWGEVGPGIGAPVKTGEVTVSESLIR
jgi:hypothetical protein